MRKSIQLTARLLRALVSWGIWILGCFVVGLVLVPVMLVGKRSPFVRRLVRNISYYAHIVYVWVIPVLTLRVEGEPRGQDTPRVLVANHQSILDPLLMLSLERHLGGPARTGLFRIPILRTVLGTLGFYRADRLHPRAHGAGSAAEKTGRRTGSFLFFPEGTRTRDGEIGPFYKGAFRLAVEQNIPIQPIVLDGLHQILPRGAFVSKSPRREVVTIRYLGLIEPPYGDGPPRQVARILSDRIRGELIDELSTLRQDS